MSFNIIDQFLQSYFELIIKISPIIILVFLILRWLIIKKGKI